MTPLPAFLDISLKTNIPSETRPAFLRDDLFYLYVMWELHVESGLFVLFG